MVNMALDGVYEAKKARQTEAAAAAITRLLQQARASQPAVQAPIWPAAAVPQLTPPRISLLEPLPVSDDPGANSSIRYVNLVTTATPARGPQTSPLPEEMHQINVTEPGASQQAAPVTEPRAPGLLELLGPLEMPGAIAPAETARPVVSHAPPAAPKPGPSPIRSPRMSAPNPQTVSRPPRPAPGSWLWALDPNPLHRAMKAPPLHPGPDHRWRIIAQELGEVGRSVQLIAYQVLEPPLAWLSDIEHASGLIDFDRLAVRGIRAVVPTVQHWRQAVARSLDGVLHKWRALLNRLDASIDNLSFQLDHSARLLRGGGAAGQLQVARVTHQLSYVTDPLVPVPGRGQATSVLPPVQFVLWHDPPPPQAHRVVPLAHTAVRSPLTEPGMTRRAQETKPRPPATPTRPKTPAIARSAPATVELPVSPETQPLQKVEAPYLPRPRVVARMGPRQFARTLADFKRATACTGTSHAARPKAVSASAPSISLAQRRAALRPATAAAMAAAAGHNSDRIVIPSRRRRRQLQPPRAWFRLFRNPRTAFAEDAFLI